MKRKSGFREIKIWMTAFLLAEGILYAVILIREAKGADVPALRYLSVVIAFAAAFFLWFIRRTKEQAFLLVAMVFTAAADVFLVLLDRFYELAVGLFFIAQCLHAFRIGIGAGKKPAKSVAFRIAASALGLVFLFLFRQCSLLMMLGVFYAAELCFNWIDSGLAIRREPRFLLSFIGFFLFILCDLTVGLNGVGHGFGIPDSVIGLSANLTWVFYLPSQVLIVLSACDTLCEQRTES